MSATLPITSGWITGALEIIATAAERAPTKIPMPKIVFIDVCTLGIADIAPTNTVNASTTPTIFHIPVKARMRIACDLAITPYRTVNETIKSISPEDAAISFLKSIRSDDNIVSATAIAVKTPPIAIMLFLASTASFDKPSRRANTAPIAPIAPTARHILSSGK